MAAPSLHCYTTGSGGGSSVSLTKPSSGSTALVDGAKNPAAGDYLLAALSNDSGDASVTWTPPDGTWTQIATGDVGNGTSDAHTTAFIKKLDGTEGSSFSFSSSGPFGTNGALVLLSGVHQTQASALNGQGSDVIDNTPPIAITGFTPGVVDVLALAIYCFDGGDDGGFTVSGTGWNELLEYRSGTGSGNEAGGIAYKKMSSIAATGTCTVSVAVSDGMAGVQFGIAPAVSATAIGKEVGLEWDILDLAGDLNELDWDVLDAVGDQSDLEWNVLSSLGDGPSLEWDVLDILGDGAQLEWGVAGLAGDSIQSLWDIVGYVFDASSLEWNIADAVSDNVDLDWAIHNLAGDSSALEWRVAGVLGDSSDLNWSVRSIVSDLSQLEWDIAEAVADHVQLEWDIVGAVGDASDIQWGVLETVFDAGSLEWEVLSTVGDESELWWGVASAVGDMASLLWGISGPVFDSADLQWGVNAYVADAVDLDWNILTSIGDATELAWAIRHLVPDELDVEWDIASYTGDSASLLWTVRNRASDLLVLAWGVAGVLDVDTAMEVSKALGVQLIGDKLLVVTLGSIHPTEAQITTMRAIDAS